MVDEINSQNTWRQITSPSRVKKVKPRPDYNRDKRSNQNGSKGGIKKDRRPGKQPNRDSPNGDDLDDVEKKAAADLGQAGVDEQKNRNGRTHGKLIDIVV